MHRADKMGEIVSDYRLQIYDLFLNT